MPESYRGYELNLPNDPSWGTRENTFHKQIIDRVEDGTVNEAPSDGKVYARKDGAWTDSLLPQFNNNRYVSPDGSDSDGDGSIAKPYATISHALSTITDAAIDNSYGIVLAAGRYTETQIVCKEFVTIGSIMPTAIVAAADPDTDLFIAANNSPLVGFNILGPDNAVAVLATTPNAVTTMRNITMIGGDTAIRINGSGTNVTITNLYLVNPGAPFSFGDIIEVLEGDLEIQGCIMRGGTTATTAIKMSGANSTAHVYNFDNDSSDVNRFLDIQNGASISINMSRSDGGDTAVYVNNATTSINNLTLSSPNIGVDVGPVGFTTLILNGCVVTNSITYDLQTQTQTMVLSGLNNAFDDSKINYVAGPPTVSHNLSHFSSDEGDAGLRVKAELGVGAPDRPAESALGEGDSYTRGILVYQYDPTNGYNDITEEAKSYSGSTFGWSDVVTDSAIYACSTLQEITGDIVKYYGFKVSINTPGVIGTGSVITEYWNGTAWTPFTIMRTEGNPPYYPRTENLIEAPAGSYQIRHNAIMELDWTKNDPIGLGTDYYWTRVRITSDITTSPLFEQFKLHSNRTEFNDDGWVEYFGKARPIGRLPWTYGMLEAAAASPGNQDNYLSDNLDVGKRENAFANNATDRIGMLAPVPFDMDTSTPIRMRWATSYSGNTGDVDWIVRWGYSTEDDLVYYTQGAAPATHPTEQSTSLTVTVPATTNQIQWNVVDLSIFGLNPRNTNGVSDILWVSIERDGAGDTFGGTASLVALSGDYLKWTEGGHIGY